MVTLCREKVLNAGQRQAGSAGDGQGNHPRGGVLELALKGHRGEAMPGEEWPKEKGRVRAQCIEGEVCREGAMSQWGAK